ncbi:MAG: hypothetical protein HN891_00045 [Planctomycetes bacterium]|jgi:adenylate cyclase|nr:hypothetical protein [Planctomycetota bacterium]MBT6452933.1 hypothetical protein [Planctomycetota bacterium]MBT6541430.1 hypothetical protein [Planctomycetota bacterium]MBT6785551.1 hypothetical protein [Planctomycetota bacterium]MBT6968329.1 hypothetical protein [Planctomycetota bacterium]
MTLNRMHLTALALILAIVWAFASAPPALPDHQRSSTTATIPIGLVLETVARENDVVRSLYTKSIVGAGLKAGLRFDENWKNADVQAGPLPALFLREAALSIQQNPVRLALFLGSHQPISDANQFSGSQTAIFEKILTTGEAEHFFDPGLKRWTAMFPDYASVMACVKCHNEHPDSPKKDWVLDDVMGATTWSYPHETVSPDEFVNIIDAVRGGFRDAYRSYLQEIESFDNKPEIGTQWPSDGYAVPDEETFMKEFEQRISADTLNTLLESRR